jgi:hypothetical protein
LQLEVTKLFQIEFDIPETDMFPILHVEISTFPMTEESVTAVPVRLWRLALFFKRDRCKTA